MRQVAHSHACLCVLFCTRCSRVHSRYIFRVLNSMTIKDQSKYNNAVLCNKTSPEKSLRTVESIISKTMNTDYNETLSMIKDAQFCDCNSEDCRCGENNVHEWAWVGEDTTYPVALLENNLEIKFHRGFSYGTAAVRGNKLLEKGRHHYWEIKMLTPMHGTDIMVGVGTDKVNLNGTRHTFCSFLGLDHESFGYSYQGYIQHGGEKRNYGPRFWQGSIVGLHLDTWKGTLEFFLNRKSLGIAFTGLRDITLYPMVSSTVSESKVRLTHSCSVPASLQIECLSVLKSSHRAYLSAKLPGLRHLADSIFAVILKSHSNDDDEDNEKDEIEFLTDHVILDDFDFALVGIRRKKTGKKPRNSCLA